MCAAAVSDRSIESVRLKHRDRSMSHGQPGAHIRTVHNTSSSFISSFPTASDHRSPLWPPGLPAHSKPFVLRLLVVGFRDRTRRLVASRHPAGNVAPLLLLSPWTDGHCLCMRTGLAHRPHSPYFTNPAAPYPSRSAASNGRGWLGRVELAGRVVERRGSDHHVRGLSHRSLALRPHGKILGKRGAIIKNGARPL